MSTVPSAGVSGKTFTPADCQGRYGIARVDGRGSFGRTESLKIAKIVCDDLDCRAYVFDYGAKQTVHRNWEGGAS